MTCGFVIPVYNHGAALHDVVRGLQEYRLPVIIVDDGNDAANRRHIADVVASFSNTILVERRKNGGKGRAMRDGLYCAQRMGLSHVLQIDADGQHDSAACRHFFAVARQHPEALVCGCPVYDDSAPSIRRKGRVFSTVWARIVTLNMGLEDVLCGFRVYPVEPYLRLLRRHAILDSRMGYDVDILVHLSWLGVPVISCPVRVTYPQDGVSNFRMVRDNLHISFTFARLCLGMVVRLPMLLRQVVQRKHDA